MLWSVICLIFKTSSVTHDFFTFFILFYHFLPAAKVSKKSVRGNFWARTSFKAPPNPRVSYTANYGWSHKRDETGCFVVKLLLNLPLVRIRTYGIGTLPFPWMLPFGPWSIPRLFRGHGWVLYIGPRRKSSRCGSQQQKKMFQISSFCAATTLRVWGSWTHRNNNCKQ